MNLKEGWLADSYTVHVVEVVGPVEEVNECLDFLYGQGYSVTYKGLCTNNKLHPAVDETRFLLRAEKRGGQS